MYTDEDLSRAAAAGIFSDEDVSKFREFVSSEVNSPSADEEKFRLITGFNDVFVVISSALLLISAVWLAGKENLAIGMLVLALLSWALSEYFVLRRNMALPAIVLLFTFIGGIGGMCVTYLGFDSENTYTITAFIIALFAWLHWKRFRVPVTVAAGIAAILGCAVAFISSFGSTFDNWVSEFLFVGGILVFLCAMYWDASDKRRISRHSDIAFWLHILSAPLIVHPVFSSFGLLEGQTDIFGVVIILILFVFIIGISLVIDRRAFMVSSLIYVLYAVSDLFENYGFVSYSFAVTGIILGSTLLILSVFWTKSRSTLVQRMPGSIRDRVPAI